MIATQRLTPEMQALSTEMLNSLGPALKSTYDLSAKLPPALNGLSAQIGTTFAVKMPEQVQKAIDNSKKLEGGLKDVTRALSELSQIAGGSFADVARGLASMVASANTAKESFGALKAGIAGVKTGDTLNGILSVTSGVMCLVSAAIQAGKALANIFDRNKGRDLVETFAETFGGFDALHAKLLEIGAEGEALCDCADTGRGP